MAYGYERMSSLVPELVKKRCKSINAEPKRSVKLLNNALSKSVNPNMFIGAPVAGFFAAAAA